MRSRIFGNLQKNNSCDGFKRAQRLVLSRQLSRVSFTRFSEARFGKITIAVAAASAFTLYGLKKWKPFSFTTTSNSTSWKLNASTASSSNTDVLMNQQSNAGAAGEGTKDTSTLTPWHKQNAVTKEVCLFLFYFNVVCKLSVAKQTCSCIAKCKAGN